MTIIVAFVIDFFLWPFVLPVIVALIAHFLPNVYYGSEFSNLSKKDSEEYISLDKNYNKTAQLRLSITFSYAFLSNAIWGISASWTHFRSTGQESSILFLVFYFFLVLWSIIIILHVQAKRLVPKSRAVKTHLIIAMIIFIVVRIGTYTGVGI